MHTRARLNENDIYSCDVMLRVIERQRSMLEKCMMDLDIGGFTMNIDFDIRFS